jgi:UDP-MurNAc hydroxylase
MQIYMLGHASIFVETKDSKILMDPVLWNSHAEGIEDIYPQREIFQERIPEFDTLIISHRHTDHFDIRSLANLPKHVDVLIPKDKFMEDCLRQLGYRHIYTLQDFSEVRIGSTRLIASRSENRVPEFGMVFADPDGVFWNQVDSVVGAKTIGKIKSRYPQIDFLLAGWQAMLESQYQDHRNISFPFSAYSNTLELINLVKPKAIAPGANGFKFINGSAWLNQVVFPVTREQFCQDVKIVDPTLEDRVFVLDPGDLISLVQGEVNYSPQKSTFVQKLAEDKDLLSFSPVNLDSKLIDDNPEGYDLEEMKNTIKEELDDHLPQFFREHQQTSFLQYCHWEVIYQLEVVYRDHSEAYYFDFSEESIQCRQGSNPLANAFSTISASSFYGLLKGFKGWDFANLGGYYRCYHKVYQATSHGIVKLADSSNSRIPDPLSIKYPYKEVYERVRNHEIKTWGQTDKNQELESDNLMTMVRIGKTLTRPQQTKIDVNEQEKLQLLEA